MSWRRGELWLDTDVLWFREVAGAPALAGFAPASLPSPASPPGLTASRLRRAAWERRRHARRARAAALTLSPAVMFVVAGLRSSGPPETSFLVEDPPSLTFRADPRPVRPAVTQEHPTAPHDTAGVGPDLPVPDKPTRVSRAVARADAAPRIDWHHATSVGLPYNGSLIGGTQLPVEGPDWVTWNPVADSVPNAARRLYGNEHTIRAIVSVAAAYRAASPGAPRVVVGDISREGGGPMTDEHISHQNGLDVDVYFPRLDGKLRAPVAPEQIDYRLAQELVDRFVAAGAQMIFVGFSTGLHGPAGVVIPYSGHDYHMHVRFPPPAR